MLLSKCRSSAYSKPDKLLNTLLYELRVKQISTKMNNEQQASLESNLVQKLRTMVASTPNAVAYQRKEPPQLRREKQLQAAKKKSVAYIPGTVNLQVLGAGANGAPSTLYLFTDQSRYLFNCGEGTQRLAHEHKNKLARLEQIFVTRNTWPMIGGFPGLALTVQDAGVRELVLNGPQHLDSIMHSMKRFVVLKTLQVKTNDCTQGQDFEDAVMTIKCIPLYRNVKAATEEPAPASDKVVIMYICKLKPRPGALNLEKCVAYGVPPGPLLGQLKNGKDVTLANGTLVRSKDVSEPDEVALTFVILDIPDEEFLPALQEQVSLIRSIQSDNEQEIALVVHFSPPQVLENNCYKSFIQNFSANTQHLYLDSPKNCFSGYISAHRIQYQLNLLNPKIFPLLNENPTLSKDNGISSKLKKTKLIADVENNSDNSSEQSNNHGAKKDDASQTTGLNSLTNFHMRPRKGLDRSTEAKLNPNEYINETQALEGFPALLESLKSDLSIATECDREHFPKITFLGTGSCIPNKTRNVSAILVQPHETSFVLLDCGEGTLGQIVRFYGKAKAEEVVRNLKIIYISHLHADHHIGLIGLLNERARLLEDVEGKSKLLVLAPRQIQPWLDFYNERIEHINGSYELIGNGDMLKDPLELSNLEFNTGVRSISTCLVRHCAHSFGISLILDSLQRAKPIKITYSGDSMPCQDLIELGRDSTVLIHEATMEDDLIEEAKVKMHSTISQAIEQGREMQAEHIILTHFSQRYAKLPRMQNIAEDAEVETMRNVAIAFDNMQVTIPDLEHFHKLYPALKALFAEHAEELEQKALKRELKLERKRKLLSAD